MGEMIAERVWELWNLVVVEESALNARDKAVVPILTLLSFGLSGLEPEEMLAAIAMSLGLIILGGAGLGCCGKFRKGAASLAILIMILAAASKLWLEEHSLTLPPHGVLPLDQAPRLPAIEGKLICDGPYFKDELGRVLLLRGVNLGGDTKVPTKPFGASFRKEEFYNTQGVSFVGRPFPLAEADEHLSRLRAWGLTFLRFLITWEAVEHEGPGIYDMEYLEYLLAVIRKCAEHGISVFIDPHQDVWSRWTGGDGAPAWTLTKVGFNIENLHRAGAAMTHQEQGDPYPQMEWPTNYNRLAAATMFTLFFAGNTFAPNTMVDGIPVQDFLQNHYLNAIKQVAMVLKDEPNVLGYDTLNEPSTGYAGLQHLSRALFAAPMGRFMSGFDGMVLGAGRPVKVPVFTKPLIFDGFATLNPDGVLAWKSHKHDIWRNEGVWDFDEDGEPRLLKPRHFSKHAKGGKVHFMRDFMVPFFEKFKDAVHSVHPDVVIFAEPFIDPNKPVHDPAPSQGLSGERYAWAPHYYDAMTLLFKRARTWVALDIQIELPIFGAVGAQDAITRNLAHVKETGLTLAGRPGGGPVLVGETGIPMDLDRDEEGMAKAYKTGDFSHQVRVLSRTMQALDQTLLSFTLWNYSPSNNNKRGDLWNDEDLSLFSRDQQSVPATVDLHSGGRALAAAVRPYPMKVSGIPKTLNFDPLAAERPFSFTFVSSSGLDPTIAPTVIFVPHYQYPQGILCEVSDGTFTYDRENQHIIYLHDPAKLIHSVNITAAVVH